MTSLCAAYTDLGGTSFNRGNNDSGRQMLDEAEWEAATPHREKAYAVRLALEEERQRADERTRKINAKREEDMREKALLRPDLIVHAKCGEFCYATPWLHSPCAHNVDVRFEDGSEVTCRFHWNQLAQLVKALGMVEHDFEVKHGFVYEKDRSA